MTRVNVMGIVNQKLLGMALMLSLMLISACGGGSDREELLRIGTHTWPGYEPLHLARSLGHIDERIKLVEFASASNVIRAMKNGSIDGATLTLDEALVVMQSGIDIKVVLVNDFSAGGDAILLSSRYAKDQPLKGLRIGVEGGAVGAYTLSRALELQGLSLADVTPVQLKPIEQREPLREGRVDGVVTIEPYRSQMLADGAIEVFSSQQLPGEIVDVTVLSRSSITNNPELSANLSNSWYEAVDFINSQPESAYGRMAQRQLVSVEEVRQGLKLVHLPTRVEAVALLQKGGGLRANTKRLMEFMVSQKLLPESMNTDSLFR